MHKLTIISDDLKMAEELARHLKRGGFACLTADIAGGDAIMDETDLVLLDMNGSSISALDSRVRQKIDTMKRGRTLPIIAMLDHERIADLSTCPFIDDFVVKPWILPELEMRVRRSLYKAEGIRNKDIIDCGDLTMDMAQCVVSQSGEPVDMTFTEYGLLKFMMLNRGRVHSRDSLLNKVWGYDYFGGERTVDVHIRRLRSKIEDVNHVYIETVRNVGYRFDDFGSR